MEGPILGHSDRRRKGRNGRKEGRRSAKVANATMCEGC